jgi:hypothetical protein
MRNIPSSSLVLLAVVCQLAAQASILEGPIVNPDNGYQYYLLSPNNWTGAEAEAEGLGGHLATITSASENAWVVQTFTDFGGTGQLIWIGLYDISGTYEWAWVSGAPVVYTNWSIGEPDNPYTEHFVYLYPNVPTTFGRWNNYQNLSTEFNGSVPILAVAEVVPEPATMIPAAVALVAVMPLLPLVSRARTKAIPSALRCDIDRPRPRTSP